MNPEPQRAETRFEWRIDDMDGQIFRRFRRNRGLELWLVGFERPLDPAYMEGRMIRHPNGEVREARHVVLTFEFDPNDMPDVVLVVNELRDSLAAGTELREMFGLVERLWLLGKQPDPFPTTIRDEDVARIANKVHELWQASVNASSLKDVGF